MTPVNKCTCAKTLAAPENDAVGTMVSRDAGRAVFGLDILPGGHHVLSDGGYLWENKQGGGR